MFEAIWVSYLVEREQYGDIYKSFGKVSDMPLSSFLPWKRFCSIYIHIYTTYSQALSGCKKG